MNKKSNTKPIAAATSLRLRAPAVREKATLPAGYEAVHIGIVDLLQAARAQAARSVNALMTASYWEIGRRIVEAEQKGKRRAEYGEQLIERLADDLSGQFGRGFSRQNLWQIRSFFLNWPPETILQTPSGESSKLPTLSGKSQKLQAAPALSQSVSEAPASLAAIASRFPLPWSAYVRLLSVKSSHARRFYETEALRGGWSVR